MAARRLRRRRRRFLVRLRAGVLHLGQRAQGPAARLSRPAASLAPQGQYYCSVGAENAIGREIVEEHLDLCLEAGLNVEGINCRGDDGPVGIPGLRQGCRARRRRDLDRSLPARANRRALRLLDQPGSPSRSRATGMVRACTRTSRTSCSAPVASQAVYDQVCKAFEPVVARAHCRLRCRQRSAI